MQDGSVRMKGDVPTVQKHPVAGCTWDSSTEEAEAGLGIRPLANLVAVLRKLTVLPQNLSQRKRKRNLILFAHVCAHTCYLSVVFVKVRGQLAGAALL